MTTNKDFWLIVGVLLLTVIYRQRDIQSGAVRLPQWLWTVIGGFLLLMVLRHANDTLHFVTTESDAWWPIVKSNAQDLTKGLRHLFITMKDGAN
jgi:hypothetical protein